MTHTPGPWRVSMFYAGLSVESEKGEHIFDFAGADSEGEPWWEQTKADAALCAAAPDLYIIGVLTFFFVVTQVIAHGNKR